MKDNLHDLAGAYALDALDELEGRRFERHLRTCEPCRQEVRSFAEGLARVSFSLAEEPPPAMRDRVLGEIASTRYEPTGLKSRRWFLAGVAALLVVVVGGGILYAGSTGRQIAAIYGAADSVTVDMQPSAGFNGTGTLAWSDQRGQGVLALHRLGALPADRDYQIWVIGTESPVSAGVFDPRDGEAEVLIDAEVFAGAVVAVTIEPAGGLPAPSTDPVLVAQL